MKYHQKMFHYIRITAAAVVLVVVYTIQVYAASGGSEPSYGSILDEPEIFAKVLKETLDAAGLGEFVPGPFGVRSPIETGIRADYIPTVGLIVRIPVSFPISTPSSEPASVGADSESKDLWEKYSKGGGLRSEPGRRVVELRKEIDAPVRIQSGPNTVVHREDVRIGALRGIHEGKDGELDEAAKFFVERFAPQLDIRMSGLAAVPYDEARVAKLRETILDAVAKYGHRVSSLQEGERIIVLVEAPMSSQQMNVVVGEGEGEGEPVEVFVPLHVRMDGKKEHMLIAVPKSAVVSASTRDAIAGQVTEKRY